MWFKVSKYFLASFLTVAILVVFSVTSISSVKSQNIGNSDQSSIKLVMFSEKYCYNCEQFMQEMRHKYIRSDIGQNMKLEVSKSHYRAQRKYRLKRAITATPTFVVIKDGREVSRFIGYMGPRRFWGSVKSIYNRIRNS